MAKRPEAHPCYAARWQFGWQGEAVASNIAQRVFSEIRKIAGSDIPLPERRADAAKTIAQFKTDLAAAHLQPKLAEEQKENLRRVLQRAATRHDFTAEQNSVYAGALDVLMR